ncbi:MAG: hypothetical protein JKY15_05530 [Deltaproteobacteria bacterium]|nr:hypothetical protein [Deltaproteobacteria bacterium]
MRITRLIITGSIFAFAFTGHAQYGANKTFPAIIQTAEEAVAAANRIADSINNGSQILNNTNMLGDQILAAVNIAIGIFRETKLEIKGLKEEIESAKNTIDEKFSTGFIVGTVAASVTISVLIGATFVFIRHMVNRHNCCGASEQSVARHAIATVANSATNMPADAAVLAGSPGSTLLLPRTSSNEL